MQRASKKELDELYNKISDDRRNEATLIYNELSFIIDTIEVLKDEIRTKGATEHFINGKQDFLRESPALASYNKMMKTYDIFYKNLINLLGTSTETEQPQVNGILDLDDFKFEFFINESYDIYDIVTNNPKYKDITDEDERESIYDMLMEQEYNEYKKNPSAYLKAHEVKS